MELARQEEYVHVDQLREILCSKPTDVVYFVYENVLYGLISTEDILWKNKNGYVTINKTYTKLDAWDSIKARSIFKERCNIHKIPVINEKKMLIGDYSVWNFDWTLEWHIKHIDIERIKKLAGNICLAEPRDLRTDKGKSYIQMREKFDELRISYEVCGKSDLLEKLNNEDNIFLVADQDEKMGFLGICATLFLDRTDNIFSCTDFLGSSEEETFKKANGLIMKKLVSRLRNQGISCYELAYPLKGKNNDYILQCEREINERLRNVKGEERIKIREDMAKEFFGDIYTDEYWKDIRNLPGAQHWVNGILKLKDVESKYMNAKGGERRTVGQPDKYRGTIYCVGPCDICGRWSEDKYTIASFLQTRLNEAGYRYRVANYGIWAGNRHAVHNIINVVEELNLMKGDIVIFSLEPDESFAEDSTSVDYYEIIEKNTIPSVCFVDGMGHHNHKVNEIVANSLFDLIKPELKRNASMDLSVKIDSKDIMREYIMRGYIDYYFSGFDDTLYNQIGSVVVCCNPFTRGHRYLIETAASRVDFLIVFVVEENGATFTFEERYAMVRKGTADLSNVMVVPSGRFLISQATFPEYFLKIVDEDIVQNVNYDVSLFADYIARPLHISCRFVGTEPLDMGTNAYNDAMKRILPGRGFQLIEIPRKEYGGACISASKVRGYLEEGNENKAFEIVPDTTKLFL